MRLLWGKQPDGSQGPAKREGERCPAIDGGTKPADALPNFTSKVWPVAAGMLGIALGKSIPCEANIFVNDDTKAPLAINETVALVLKI
ncbi:MAG: hypothetical protein JWO25_888, partial [Alphaproteobacteria bacterium]|nr:hypothetical protein [Alphaproteobacteria bacterium]